MLAFYVALQEKKGPYCDRFVWNESVKLCHELGSIPPPTQQPTMHNCPSLNRAFSVEEAGERSSPSSTLTRSVFRNSPLLPIRFLPRVDPKLIDMHGDTIHENDASHMAGNILAYCEWQLY
eukprot:7314972-Ditylum_brightwellii.AAC.1